MNSLQLHKILSKYKNFLGIFARDELPYKVKYPSFFVFNTDNRSEPGEHWLAIFIDEDKKAEFFDSYGNHPRYFRLEKYLDKIARSWTYNGQRIQDYFSQLCGHYCVYFLIQKLKDKTLLDKQNELKNQDNNFILNFNKQHT